MPAESLISRGSNPLRDLFDIARPNSRKRVELLAQGAADLRSRAVRGTSRTTELWCAECRPFCVFYFVQRAFRALEIVGSLDIIRVLSS